MAVHKIRDRTYRPLHLAGFAGGEGYLPQTDQEGSSYINFDPLRDGNLTTRLGIAKLNSNSVGSGIIQGLGVTSWSGGSYIVACKNGTTWYYAQEIYDNMPSSVAFTSFVVPESPGGYPVRMESFTDANNAGWALFVSQGFATSGVIKFDGTTASAVASSPIGKYIRTISPHVYVAGITGKPYTIRWCDTDDFTIWPTDNSFDVPASFGPITGLERQPGMLIIFCAKGIIGLRGDPPEFTTFFISEYIGCTSPNSISTYGTSSAFVNNGDFYILSGGTIKLLTDKAQGRSFIATGCTSEQVWGALGPRMYMVRPTKNTTSAGTAAAVVNTSNENVFCFERERFQWNGAWSYPAASGQFGYQTPQQSCILALSPYRFLLAGGDGNVYSQDLRRELDSTAISLADDTTLPKFTIDVGGGLPAGTFTSKRLQMGSSLVQKQFRKILVGGTGRSMSLDVYLYGPDFTRHTLSLVSNINAPFSSEIPSINGDTGYSHFSSIQLNLSGTSMYIDGIDILWRPVRFATSINISP